MEIMNLPKDQQILMKKEIQQEEAEILRKKRQKISPKDFEPISIIGRGAFGEVWVCRSIENKQVVAIKKMKKKEMVNKNQVGHIRAERDVLATANTNWVVDLLYSF